MPAVNSPRKSVYRASSIDHRYGPSPRANVSGNGSKCRTVRVLPPGITRVAARCRASLVGFALT
jgi:hypothetical protein